MFGLMRQPWGLAKLPTLEDMETPALQIKKMQFEGGVMQNLANQLRIPGLPSLTPISEDSVPPLTSGSAPKQKRR